ncbi:endonuclease/exonuclease/phosphatase family protein [Actinomycetospora sp. TBRC 11914]|uniref:endonuclease/exonuclease/phosphatase family protein n=1 Tax=Actinomycetospora sp. TBRC 11914 TaxID=2729387 RepID=UPI00145D45CC|nr:endonuclease/exonuclease/phosphatase family protein [Actinomycetospora sp. TBRC 11914]NMO92513.1 endonuclease/exonuclease/phosphatase family protein [Actinomycetospora sp. TBRC 11914]
MTTTGRPLRTRSPGEAPGRAAARRAVVLAVATLLAVVVLVPDTVGLDRVLPFAVLAALRPDLAAGLGGVALVLLAWRRRWWPALVPVLVVAAVAGAVVVPRAVAAPAPPPGGTALTVLELNAFEGHADPRAIAALARSQGADLIVLPESGERMRARLAPLLPGWRTWTNAPPSAPDVRGIVVAAAPRAGDVTARRLDTDTRYPWAEVTGGILGPTRLVAVHLVSPVPGWVSYWPGELEMLRQWCAPGGDPTPAMVVGDLNATGDHSAFRAGTAGCTDAATATGGSLVPTWRSSFPRWFGAQIDHVLTRPGADGSGPRARSTEVVAVPGSDHRALLTRLRL